ncbi:HlyC/CorC family transporter [uncultured Sneathiella sp.]|jgi:Mg2+/Co2+ transporter CorB|uniref:HlyC/CorC family transporter n=2 Tax=uncultured Sneathiella sp. TaxID=879315 RepID=UPI0030DC4BC6|tara:strand:- start:57858 stop:59150 length:1293 start_codon:yes stop_codon:yes gene_type:complete
METVDFDVELIFLPLAILFLLLLSAFFSGSETALTGASRARLHQMEQSGNHRASLVNRLRDKHTKLISAILLGNNLVNILASSLATSIFISYFGDIGVAYATLVMTVLVLVFAEVLPKTIALRRTIPVALFVAPLLQPAIVLLSPIVMSINYIVDTTLSLMGIKGYDGDTDTLTDAAQDELRGAIELHSEDAGIIMHERYMLDTILDMDEVDLGEIMVHRKNVEMVDGAKPVREIIDQVLGSPYTRLPLWKDNPENIIGVVHAKDLLRALIPLDGDYEKLDFEAIAVEPWFVPETTTLRSQLNAFLDRKSHFALVVDEYGALMGLVTLEDILEEIVGEIADEHDLAVSDIRMLKDGRVVTKGDVTIRDLNRQLNWSLPDEEAATIAGLVIHEAQIIPDIGQAFLFHGYKFEVMRKEHNQITELRITPLEL